MKLRLWAEQRNETWVGHVERRYWAIVPMWVTQQSFFGDSLKEVEDQAKQWLQGEKKRIASKVIKELT